MARRYYGKVRNADNVNILNAIRNDASLDYHKRIPAATKGNVADVADAIFNFRPHKNEFIESLINRIGLVYARNAIWYNPLGELKRGALEFGDTIEEIQVGIVKANHYNHDRDYLERDIFGRADLDVATAFHTVDREDFYKITIDDNTLKRAFLDPSGLDQLTQQIMSSPTTADNWDEYLMMSALFRVMDNKYPMFNVNVPDVAKMDSTEPQARSLLRKIRATAGNMQFLSTRFNGAKMPVAAKPEDLILFATPEVKSGLDVNALAALFNVSYADVPSRIIEIRQEDIAMNGVQAFLTTKDFFVIADTSLETTSEFNPISRQTNFFLHHWEIISASPFAPIVKFSTAPDTARDSIEIAGTVTIDHLQFVVDSNEQDVRNVDKTSARMVKGGMAQLEAVLTGLKAGQEDIEFTEQWSIEGNKDTSTRIDNDGLIYMSPNESSQLVIARAKVSWIDPATGKYVTKTQQLSIVPKDNVAGLNG